MRVFIESVFFLPESRKPSGLPVHLNGPDDGRDGNWWNRKTAMAKLSHASGFPAGMELGYNLSHWKFANKKAESAGVGKVAEWFDEYSQKYLNNVT
jgi:hypothetical protein